MKMVRSDVVEEATKALYAVSALIRNNFDGQKIFYAEAGDLMLKVTLDTSLQLQKPKDHEKKLKKCSFSRIVFTLSLARTLRII